jgi:uncharacterized protein YodC (DUF2158 family)
MSLKTPHSTLTAGLAVACIAASLFESTKIAAASTITFRSGRLPALPPFALAAAAHPPTIAKAIVLTSHTLDTLKYGLRLGDLVRVKSGGPMMTVRAIKGTEAICEWANSNGSLQSSPFPIADLVAIGGTA